MFTLVLALSLSIMSFAATEPTPRVSHFTCNLNLALATNDGSAAKVFEKLKPSSELKFQANLSGRGIADCKNEQGFQFTLPTMMSISVNSSQEIPLESLHATLAPLSVDRDVNRIFDVYTPHIVIGATPNSSNISTEKAVVVRGEKNDLLMQLNLSVPPEDSPNVNVSRVDIKFDGKTSSQ